MEDFERQLKKRAGSQGTAAIVRSQGVRCDRRRQIRARGIVLALGQAVAASP